LLFLSFDKAWCYKKKISDGKSKAKRETETVSIKRPN